MRFVKRLEFQSVYTLRGQRIYVPHGEFTKYEFSDRAIQHLWDQSPVKDQDGFTEYLRARITEPSYADYLTWCEDCDRPGDTDSGCFVQVYTWRSERIVCDDCLSNYWHCDDCEDYFESTNTTLVDTEVCDGCRDSGWSYCDECDGYYRDGYGCEGDHGSSGCDCEAPHQRFTIRNNGHEPLAQDERTTVALPAGVISDVGIGQISRLLREVGYSDTTPDEDKGKWSTLSYSLPEIGPEATRRDGNYAKRLSKYAYKTLSLKVPADVMSKVGNLVAAHSQGADLQVEVTRNLNLPAEEFAHEDSCWWQSYSYSRCTLKSNGGFGLRSFADNGWGTDVSGRAWVMPLTEVNGELRPTTDTMTPTAFMIFNGYGQLSGYTPARIMAYMAGASYKKVDFDCDPMYVNSNDNGGSGYLVAAEDVLARFDQVSLRLDQHARLAAPPALVAA